jgi:hypothetical protein
VSSVTSATRVRLAGFPGRFAQRETGLLGSASTIATVAPCPASSVARTTAEVDFPAPPLGLAKTLRDYRALFLSEGGVQVQQERLHVRAEIGHQKRRLVRHEPTDEVNVTREPVELGDRDRAWPVA